MDKFDSIFLFLLSLKRHFNQKLLVKGQLTFALFACPLKHKYFYMKCHLEAEAIAHKFNY